MDDPLDAGRVHVTGVARPALRLASALLLTGPLLAQGMDRPPSWDVALRWEGERHGTLGPTGRRLFATHVETAPGVRGRFHYGSAQVRLDDPIRLEVLSDGRPLELEPQRTTWFPSRLEQRWSAGALALEETELVTDDDLVVCDWLVVNNGSAPLELELRLGGGPTPSPERGGSRMVPLDLGPAASLAPVGGTPLFTDAPVPRAVWAEAEDFDASPAVVPGASAGRCVRAFGARSGARQLLVVTAPPLGRPELALRYANASGDVARLAVQVDGRDAAEVELPPSAGWALARASLEELPAGRVLIALEAVTPVALDLDGLFLCEAGLDPGPLPEAGAYLARVPEQLDLVGGVRELDEVRYALPAAAEARRPTLVALRGGLDGDRARALPAQVSLAVPDVRPSRSTLHLLLRSETPRGRAARDAQAAEVTLRLDDGSVESLGWPAAPGDVLPALRSRVEVVPVLVGGLDGPTLQLSYDPPPGRAVTRLELVAGAGPEVPVLLAATIEALAETGRLPVLVGRTVLEGQPVELALAATGAVPASTPVGTRSLQAHVSLGAGEHQRLRAVLSSGPRRPQVLLQALEALDDEVLVARHRATVESWFTEYVPAFSCSDPWLEQAWRQRWYLVRRNLLRLDLPDFSLAVAYQGTCCAEHARVSPRAAASALRELRWLRDPTPAQGTLRALLKRQREDGLLLPVAPGSPLLGWEQAWIAHDLAAAAIGVWEVTGSRQYLEEITGLLTRDLDATLQRLDADGDEGLGPFLVEDAATTGMPGRPLFRLVDLTWKPVEPLELGVLLWASARALASAHAALGNAQEARRLDEVASRLATRVEDLCWDAGSAWFLSLEAEGGRIGLREIAGVLPLASGLTGPESPAALDTLFDPAAFWSPYPVRSVALGDVTDAASRSALAWDGPVHPEALAWMVDAAGREARERRDTGSRERLRRALEAATRVRFEGGALDRPLERVAWDADDGRGAGCVDALVAPYADQLVRYLAGVSPRPDGVLVIDPLLDHLEHFRFEGLRHRGRRVDVTWDRPDGVQRYEALGLGEGFTVLVDDRVAHHALALGRVALD